MILWIVTIGSSDVQLDSDKVNRDKGRTEKQRSNIVWRNWYNDDILYQCYDVSFEPQPVFQDVEESYRIAARILGKVYQLSSEKVKPQIENYLTFPLLNNFVKKLKPIEIPDAIAFILTDQSQIFQDNTQRRQPKSPYWQDTCELKLILENYFQQQFPGVELIPLQLSPPIKPGLDDWDRVLDLVQNEFAKIKLEPDIVYVSHQASTPAISSAVQFESLTLFGQRVKFLISNEQDSDLTRFIDRSSYLKRIRQQEALALLENFDYSGVYQLLKDDLRKSNLPVAQEILKNLEMAMLWNYAKFKEFLKSQLKLSPEDAEKWLISNWWQPAYEAAYLATIRLKQGNTVEAFFHSFRAVEAAFLEWGKQEFKAHIEINNDRAYLQPSILHDTKDYFKAAKIDLENPKNNNSLGNLKLSFQKLAEKLENPEKKQQKSKGIILYGTTLYRLFETQRPDYKAMAEYKRFLAEDGIGDNRNKNFHQLQGLSEIEVFKDWEVENLDKWKERLLTYLNFIAKPQKFTSLEEASLMPQLHQELKEVLNTYQPE
ncbi:MULTISPECIES: hypothetical protein [Planktothrix]|uniref:hypothetical protein n=1 Tax=Planktothrix TaxID=54304 RepID=UPI00041DE3A3|nr:MULTISPECIES: hypothetical protein [Planktothrix]